MKSVELESLSPRQILESKVVELTITGQNFSEEVTKATLFGLGAKTYDLASVKVVNATTIKATTPANLPAGPYDLKVSTKDGTTTTLGGAFEVLPSGLFIYSIDVDQGDATLIISPTGETVLIDAGKYQYVYRVEALLQKLKIKRLDHIIATHYDSDHVGGLAEVVKGPDKKANTADDRTPTKGIWDRGGYAKNKYYREMRDRISKVHKPLPGGDKDSFPTIKLGGGVSIEVLATNGSFLDKSGKIQRVECGSDENCRSIGTLIKFGKFRFWTGGDITGGGHKTPNIEDRLAPAIGKVDIYRAHHHGSTTSSNSALLKVLAPQVVIISAGLNNDYCHPNADVVSRFLGLSQVSVLVTSEGISSSGSCGKKTKDRLAGLGDRGHVKCGNILITAKEKSFSISSDAFSTKTWKTYIQ